MNFVKVVVTSTFKKVDAVIEPYVARLQGQPMWMQVAVPLTLEAMIVGSIGVCRNIWDNVVSEMSNPLLKYSSGFLMVSCGVMVGGLLAMCLKSVVERPWQDAARRAVEPMRQVIAQMRNRVMEMGTHAQGAPAA
ncbi:MAG: hypothetical protein WCF19_07740 [Chlamydiales bacterium]